MSAITQSTRPRFPSELGSEYEVHIGQNVPDPISVQWSGGGSRKRGAKVFSLCAIAGLAVLAIVTSGAKLPT